MARMVATKAALSIRVDALTEADEKSEPTAPTIGIENRAKLEARLRARTQAFAHGTPARLSYADHHGLRIPLYCWSWPSPYKSLSRRLA